MISHFYMGGCPLVQAVEWYLLQFLRSDRRPPARHRNDPPQNLLQRNASRGNQREMTGCIANVTCTAIAATIILLDSNG